MNALFDSLSARQKIWIRSLKAIVILLALLEAGWMTFDGTRALYVGDYVTPGSGSYAGQLGPWTRVVSAVGIEPGSTVMKSIFAIYGAAWLAIVGCFIAHVHGSWKWMIAAAAGSLWYLPLGTAFAAIQIPLLWRLKRRLGWR